MPSDDSTAPVVGLLDRLLDATQGYLQEIKTLERDNRANQRIWAALEKQKTPPARLTADEEALVSGKSHQSYIDEWARIGHERQRIAGEVRPGLWRQVWEVLSDLEEVDFSSARGFHRDFEKLLAEISEDTGDIEWLTDFMLGLDKLLRTARAYIPISQPLPAHDEQSSRSAIRVGPRSRHSPMAAAKLEAFMVKHGLNQTFLNKRLDGKVSTKTIRKLLRDKVATPGVLQEIADTMGIPLEELLNPDQ